MPDTADRGNPYPTWTYAAGGRGFCMIGGGATFPIAPHRSSGRRLGETHAFCRAGDIGASGREDTVKMASIYTLIIVILGVICLTAGLSEAAILP